ncbi:hypothetical protein LINPERHAP1_LOCUS7466 [Linum perenne]
MSAVHHRLLLLLFILIPSLILAQNNTINPCSLNFFILHPLVATADLPSAIEHPQACQYIRHGLSLLQSDHLLRTKIFLPPPTLVGAPTSASPTISSPTSTSAPPAASARVVLHRSFHGNIFTCSDYPSIYANAFVNFLGPTDIGTDKCLFLLNFTSNN